MHTMTLPSGVVCLLLCFLGLVSSVPVNDTQDARLSHRQAGIVCATGIHMIVAPGRGAGFHVGRLSTLVHGIKRQHRGSDFTLIDYDENSIIIESAPKQITAAIKDYATICPLTPIALIGYSVGGISILNSLCGVSSGGIPSTKLLNGRYAGNIIATILYGEESFAKNQIYNAGTCNRNAPKYARQTPAGCSAFASDIQDFCDGNDGACCKGGGPYDPDVHLSYQVRYNDDAFAFVSQHYDDYLSESHGGLDLGRTVGGVLGGGLG